MQLPVFEHAYFLQSVGWAIANSLWQTGILWLLFQAIITFDKKLPALVKYHLSLVFLFTGFTWFLFTLVQNYRFLTNDTGPGEIFLFPVGIGWMKNFNQLLPYLSIVYLFLLGCYLVKFIQNISANRLLQTKGLMKAPADFRFFVKQVAINLGISKKIQVWISAQVDVPAVTGFFKPVILLPAAIINHLSVQQVEAILLHELAHIRRNDYLVNLLQSAVELILFFNPFAFWLSKAARIERENCCDDWVMSFQYNHQDYAKALLILEEQRHFTSFTFALAATSGKKNLLFRIKRLFNATPHTSTSTIQKMKLIGLCLLLVAGFFSLFPAINNKPVKETIGQYSKKEKTTLAKPGYASEANLSKNILKAPLTKSTAKKSPVKRKKSLKKQPLTDPVDGYVNTYINEELLHPAIQEAPIATQVVEKEINTSNYIIKVEEQQSGKNETNTYYFELKDKEGDAAIKPLIIINKVGVYPKKAPPKNIADSQATSKKQVYKKRITS
jgi:beta-lactamase regulating signal transducer with metallopeptidase domain